MTDAAWLWSNRREWQMERAFQTALWLLRPEVVFILGDIFDEGKWSSQKVTTSSWLSKINQHKQRPAVALWTIMQQTQSYYSIIIKINW